jgi:hypothetical protein
LFNICHCNSGLVVISKNYNIASQNCMYFTRENSQNLRQKCKWALWMWHQSYSALYKCFAEEELKNWSKLHNAIYEWPFSMKLVLTIFLQIHLSGFVRLVQVVRNEDGSSASVWQWSSQFWWHLLEFILDVSFLAHFKPGKTNMYSLHLEIMP